MLACLRKLLIKFTAADLRRITTREFHDYMAHLTKTRPTYPPKNGLAVTFRTPPAPFRERAYALGRGFCCVCRQPVYRFGWHVDLWDIGANKNATWHSACVVAWQFWTAPSDNAQFLRRLQARRCGESGGRLWKSAEVDHRILLFRVWSEYRDAPWPSLLDYWGLPNLQVINRDVHAAKCVKEARHRRAARYLASDHA